MRTFHRAEKESAGKSENSTSKRRIEPYPGLSSIRKDDVQLEKLG